MRRSRLLGTLAFAAAVAVLSPQGARAERADRDKPVNIESDRMTADDAKKVATFEGSVVLTQGTLTIHADRIVVRQDEAGFQYGVAYGNPARFQQKREGYDEFVHGEALRVEYDGRAERVELFDDARLRRDGGDDVRGNYISYDSKTEYFTVNSGKQAAKDGRDSRVRAVIMPKKTEAPKPSEQPKPSDRLRLQPAPAIAKPD
jgi:lipopolysaccharide export system protein LptA